MNQVQRQARSELLAGTLAPATKQIPSAQPQMFGSQKPDADLIAGDLVGEQLANLALEAGGIAGLRALLAAGALGLDVFEGRLRTKRV